MTRLEAAEKAVLEAAERATAFQLEVAHSAGTLAIVYTPEIRAIHEAVERLHALRAEMEKREPKCGAKISRWSCGFRENEPHPIVGRTESLDYQNAPRDHIVTCDLPAGHENYDESEHCGALGEWRWR